VQRRKLQRKGEEIGHFPFKGEKTSFFRIKIQGGE